MTEHRLGRLYRDGEVLFRKGAPGDCMYQLQKGTLDIVLESDETKIVRTITSGEFFGEMSLFTGEPRSATIRSRGESRVLTIDEAGFKKRLKEDPVLAFRILEQLCHRLQLFDKPEHG